MTAGDLATLFQGLEKEEPCLLDPHITINHQKISKGSYVRTSQGLFHLLTLYSVRGRHFAMAMRLGEVKADSITGLLLLRQDRAVLMIDLSNFQAKFYTLPVPPDFLLLSYEDK